MTYTIMNNSAVSKEAKILPGTSICLFSMSGVKNLVANSYTSISPRPLEHYIYNLAHYNAPTQQRPGPDLPLGPTAL